jgi:UDP-N-acetylmuramoyl-L-alanyl-D-glutamate--2,6-diaminopimelate ligase
MTRLATRLDGTPLPWRLGADIDITGITADSRLVRPKMIFAALPGMRADGRDFIAAAVAQGAAAILAPLGTPWPPGTPPRPLLLDSDPRKRLAEIAAHLAGPMPRRILAVTGTNGKSSSVDFLRQISLADGRKSASLGTLGLIASGFPNTESLTTPDPVALAEQLARLRAAGIDDVALEASSHGLEQRRLDGVSIAGAAFTNLTRDHLDYHGDMAAYRAAKLYLFKALLPRGAPVVAMSDLESDTLTSLQTITKARRLELMTVGPNGSAVDLIGATPTPQGQILYIAIDGIRREIELPLVGRFQADNALLCATLARAIGIDRALDYISGLRPVHGRLQWITTLPNGAAVYVDYAHTPDALERLLAALRPHTAGRLILVFGAGGDRDTGKRPLMGAVAAHLADLAVITDDNPRHEDPALIRAAIKAACPACLELADRRRAIAEALSLAQPGDVLVVAGKGHEQGQIIGRTVIPFDDAAVITELVG